MEEKEVNNQNINKNYEENYEDFSEIILNDNEVWQTSKYGDLV